MVDETRLDKMGVDTISIRRNGIRQTGTNLTGIHSRYIIMHSLAKMKKQTNAQLIFHYAYMHDVNAHTICQWLLVLVQ